MKSIVNVFLPLACLCLLASACKTDGFGANPYDPSTPVTVSEWPKVLSFSPEKGQAGDVVTIKGINFGTASKVTFGGMTAESFEIIDDGTISAVLGPYGKSGAVAVTNHKGERSLQGFTYIWPVKPSENPNLAIGAKATASEPFSGFFAANVNDGNDKSCWVASGNDPADSRWVMIELEKLSEINMVVTKWDPNAAATDYKLEVSEDGSTFTVIAEEVGWLSNGVDNGVKKIKFAPVNAKFVRLSSMYNSVTPYNMTLGEFEIYNAPEPVNVALQKVADADCEANPNSKFHLVDGKLANMWQCDKTHETHWATINLGEAAEINNIIISMDGGAYAKDMKITVSEDGETFEEVYNVTDWSAASEPREPGETVWTKVVMNVTFAERNVSIIRLDFGSASGPWGIGIYEVEAYRQW